MDKNKKLKVKRYSSLKQVMSELQSSLAIWDHTAFVTWHQTQVNMPAITPAKQVGTQFTYPGGMEG